MGGLLGGLFPSAPDRTIVPRDADADQLMKDAADRAQNTDYATQANENVNKYANSFGAAPNNSTQTGGQNASQMDAISRAYQAQGGAALDRQKDKNALSSQFEKSEALRKASIAAQGKMQAQTQIFSQLTDAYNQQESARAGVINSIFGVARQGIAMNAGKKKGAATTNDFDGATTAGGDDPSSFGNMA